ncbi:hypothetical protein FQA39_LY17752 [Lamprigera yunnana]|nr:hypothetical protein FQA39_LY17752 [Lamprigera yunnana]
MSARVFKPITFAEIPKIRKSPNIEGNFVYKGFAKVRRSLFNPDPDDARRFIDEELTKLTNDQCDKWNFDFVTCKPKEIGQYTRYEWTPITPPIIRTPVCSLKSRILENDGHNAFLYPPIAPSSPSALDDEMLSELTDIRTRSIPKKQSLITVDSIPTSCIQLAKEQIIKYSDPKYNINDLKTGDCETMLLNQTIYYLNKSKSKWISVGLYYPFEFASVVKIFGRSKQYVIFKEEEWIQFHEQRENINKYFDTMWKPRQIGSKTLTFEMIEEKKILKIEDMSGNEVYLCWESMSEVWSLESVLRYRLSYSSGSNFKYFYEDVIRAVAEMSGDVKINIYNINRLSEKYDDVLYVRGPPLYAGKGTI